MWHDNPFDPWETEDFTPRWICFGKGGGGGAPQERTINQGGLPDYAEPFYKSLMQRAETESNRPYEPYGDQRLASLGADTQAGFASIRDLSARGQNPYVGSAGDAFQGAADYQTNGPFNTGSFVDPGVAASYMNPYVTQVLDRNRTRARQSFNEDQVSRDAAFVERGAFSNARRDVASEMARSDLNEQLLDIEAKGMADAYDQAGRLYTSDQQRDLQAQIESERAAQGAQGINVTAAQGLGALASVDQTQDLQRADAMGRIGAVQEQQDQAGLDLAYADFVNQRDTERGNVNWMSGIMHGVPVAPSSDISKFSRPPNVYTQMAGLGLGGLSLYNQLSGKKA